MDIRPFRGLRPRPDLAAKIPSLPYDVVTDAEARAAAADNPHSFLHVVRAEVDLDPSIDVHDDAVYAKARENYAAMIERGWLVPDEHEAYYAYRLEVDGHAQLGVVAGSSVDDYGSGRIKRHELTRPEKEDDRVRHIDEVGAHCGPVLLAHRPDAAIDAVLSGATSRDPQSDFTADDGVRHTLWRIDEPAEVEALRAAWADLPATYIADGHHRAASARRVAEARGARGEGGAHDRFLTILFPSDRLRVLPYNRLVRDLAGRDDATFLRDLEAAGLTVRETPEASRPRESGRFGMVLSDGRWREVVVDPSAIPDDAVERLDVALLARHVLAPILGIEDPRRDPRIEFVGGIRGSEALEKAVRAGTHAVGFAMFPTGVEAVMRVSDAGGIMPPKSTWFEPKARSGVVVHPI